MNKLEELCRPLIRLLCEYCCFVKAGARMDAETLNRKIRNCLDGIREQSETEPNLKRDFARIERPLVFFVDYTIKEGGFPFSREWRELARDYNELSGDEKFFDLLSETLDDPDASDRLMLFYFFMGLGFDGCYRNDPDFVERRMKVCATRFQSGFNLLKEPLADSGALRSVPRAGKRRSFCSAYAVLVLLILFALFSFLYNCYIFNLDTGAYKTALKEAVDKSRPAYIKGNETPAAAPAAKEGGHE